MKDFRTAIDRVPQATVIIIGLSIALTLGIVIPSTHGNILTGTAKLTGVVTFLCALVWPRTMLYGLVVMAASLDFVKRLLVVFGTVYQADLAVVLTIAPLTLGGVVCGHIIHRIFAHGRILNKREWVILACAGTAIGISFAKAMVDSHNILRAGQAVVDGMSYLLAVLVTVSLLRDDRATVKYINFMVWIFFCVALYGIFQFFHGYAKFEYDYILSSNTSTIGELSEAHPRIFSTLNSSHAFGVSMAIFLIISVAKNYIYFRQRRSFRIADLLLMITFTIALGLGFGRTAWVLALLGIAGIFFFTSARRTKFFYACCTGMFLIVLFNSEYILEKLPEWQRQLPGDSASQEQAFRLGTYSDRLIGFTSFMRDDSYWTPFGVKGFTTEAQHAGDQFYTHDAFTAALLRYGIVGVGILAIISIFFLIQVHKGILGVQNRNLRIFSAATASACFSVFFTGLLSGSNITVFPVNFLFWALIGCTLVMTGSERAVRKSQTAQQQRDRATPAPAPNRPRPRRPAYT